ncbi:hypothetical protein P692DRAFT_201810279 [Suillus brevipes Sb2]|nr:hypothetical protein P692DRAFT_201810279 [Suillus brevipes Sb2]
MSQFACRKEAASEDTKIDVKSFPDLSEQANCGALGGRSEGLILQASVQWLIIERWVAEVKRCEEDKRVQLLEVLLAAHVLAIGSLDLVLSLDEEDFNGGCKQRAMTHDTLCWELRQDIRARTPAISVELVGRIASTSSGTAVNGIGRRENGW